MKPFLFIQIRPEEAAAENEFEAILGITNIDMVRVQICHSSFPAINLDEYAGVIVGGGPATVSDNPDKKPAYQKHFEPALFELLQSIVEKDKPFIGLCYAPSAIATTLDGFASKQYPEKVGAYTISLTDEGYADPIFSGIPRTFLAFAGHKESVEQLPTDAILLASSESCPIQGYRIGKHVYAFQFHPELDAEGLAIRVDTYRHMGYFDPREAEELIAMAFQQEAPYPQQILQNFIQRFKYS